MMSLVIDGAGTCTIVSWKGAHGRYTLLCAQMGVGRYLYILPQKSADVHIFTTYNRILHTNTPAQYELDSI